MSYPYPILPATPKVANVVVRDVHPNYYTVDPALRRKAEPLDYAQRFELDLVYPPLDKVELQTLYPFLAAAGQGVRPFWYVLPNHDAQGAGSPVDYALTRRPINVLWWSEEWEHVFWTQTDMELKSSGHTDPLGGTKARLYGTAAGASSGGTVTQPANIDWTNDTNASIYIKEADATKFAIELYDVSTATPYWVRWAWSAGVPVFDAKSPGSDWCDYGVDQSPAPYADWFRIFVNGRSDDIGNTGNTLEIRYHVNAGWVSGIQSTYIFGPQLGSAFDEPLSYVTTDSDYYPYPGKPLLGSLVLTTKGQVTANGLNRLKAGDFVYLAAAKKVYLVLEDVHADAWQNMRILLNTPLRTEPGDGAAVKWKAIPFWVVPRESPRIVAARPALFTTDFALEECLDDSAGGYPT